MGGKVSRKMTLDNVDIQWKYWP